MIMEITGGAVTYNILQVPIDISNTLTYCTSNNSATQGLINKPYTATITADEGYTLEGATVSVIMNNVDVTNSVYSNGAININRITGDISISVTAVVDAHPWDGVYFRVMGSDARVYSYQYGDSVSLDFAKNGYMGEVENVTITTSPNIYEPEKSTTYTVTELSDKFVLVIPHIYGDVYYSLSYKTYDLTTTITVATTSNSYSNRQMQVKIVDNPTSSQLLMKVDGSNTGYAYSVGDSTYTYSLSYTYHTYKIDFVSDPRINHFYFNNTSGSSNSGYCMGNKTLNALITGVKLGDNYGPILVSNVFRSAKMTEVVIPGNITEIQSQAFAQCTKLTTIVLKSSTVPELSTNAFYQDSKLANIYVLDNLVNSYKTATNWVEYADIIKPISQMPTT